MFLPHIRLDHSASGSATLEPVHAVAPVRFVMQFGSADVGRFTLAPPDPEPEPDTAPEPERTAGQDPAVPCNDWLANYFVPSTFDTAETFADFEARETAVRAFGRALAADRSAQLGLHGFRIEPGESAGFVVCLSGPDGESVVTQGRYGFTFDRFERALSWAVQRAREIYVAPPYLTDNGATIERRYHSRRGQWVFVVCLPETLTAKRFARESERAEDLGGWYSAEYRQAHVPGGFMFADHSAAVRFAEAFRPSRRSESPPMARTDSAATGATVATADGPAVAAEPKRDAGPSAESVRVADRLDSLANGMQKTIDAKLAPCSQNWTPKRGRETAHRNHEGANLQRCQEALRALATCWREDSVPAVLRELKTKSAILPLVSTRGDSRGYYDYRETTEYRDNSPVAVALRELMARTRSGETAARLDEQRRAVRIRQAEDELRKHTVPGFFPTPAGTCRRMIDEAGLPADAGPDFRILEPSAGIGSLYDCIRSAAPGATIRAVEVSRVCCEVLDAKDIPHSCADFLELPPVPEFDRVLMNPPFERCADCLHVQHAFEFLKPGGRLVALMSAGVMSSSHRAAVEFREWLASHSGSCEQIDGAFRGAEAFRQTGVSVVLVVVDR